MSIFLTQKRIIFYYVQKQKRNGIVFIHRQLKSTADVCILWGYGQGVAHVGGVVAVIVCQYSRRPDQSAPTSRSFHTRFIRLMRYVFDYAESPHPPHSPLESHYNDVSPLV